MESRPILNSLGEELGTLQFPEGTPEEVWQKALGAYIVPEVSIDDRINAAIERAVDKGKEIFNRIRLENIKLGIEASVIGDRPATDVVLERGSLIMSALNSGSTKAAIRYCLNFPEDQKDPTFINNSRLLSIINELEEFHGMPLTPSLP